MFCVFQYFLLCVNLGALYRRTHLEDFFSSLLVIFTSRPVEACQTRQCRQQSNIKDNHESNKTVLFKEKPMVKTDCFNLLASCWTFEVCPGPKTEKTTGQSSRTKEQHVNKN